MQEPTKPLVKDYELLDFAPAPNIIYVKRLNANCNKNTPCEVLKVGTISEDMKEYEKLGLRVGDIILQNSYQHCCDDKPFSIRFYDVIGVLPSTPQ